MQHQPRSTSSRSLGADHVVDYTRDDFTAGLAVSDLIIDTAGNKPLSRIRRALTPRGTLVIVGGDGGGRWLGGIDRNLRATLLSPFVGQRLRGILAKEDHRDLERVSALIESGAVRPVVAHLHPQRGARRHPACPARSRPRQGRRGDLTRLLWLG